MVYEAIAYVISAMPMEQAAQSLRTFALDILGAVHAITIRPAIATKQDLKQVGGTSALSLGKQYLNVL